MQFLSAPTGVLSRVNWTSSHPRTTLIKNHGQSQPLVGSRSPFRKALQKVDQFDRLSQNNETINKSDSKRQNQAQSTVQDEIQTQFNAHDIPSFTERASGAPAPLGPSKTENGVNFALHSAHAKQVKLIIYSWDGKQNTTIDLNRHENKTGDVWHVELKDIPLKNVAYGYKVNGDGGWETRHRWTPNRVLLDPYAPYVWGRDRFGVRDDKEQFQHKTGSLFLGCYDLEDAHYDWEEHQRPQHPWSKLVIYECPLRYFTAHPSSGVDEGSRGTFKGMEQKINHLKSLGITAVELLPVFEYDELEFQRQKNPRDHMVNVWGYSHISFMAPMSRYAAHGAGPYVAAKEFKDLVKALHAAGIEVILDVVYNHTAEADDKDPYPISFRGIDNATYYQYDKHGHPAIANHSGCGNTFNSNHPVGMELVLSSLRRYVTEFQVDGFRFDLASCLCRDDKGHPMSNPPIVKAIAKDPVLQQAGTKLIAEPWDIGMYQVGSFPNWDVWAEWNGRYRDDLRKFLRGDPGLKSTVASRLCGSADIFNYNNRSPHHSVNFMVAHDGFSLWDLVSYSEKRNHANGEGNRDGCNDNYSYNHGVEGGGGAGAGGVAEGVERARVRQQKNMMLALLVSQGTPMVLAGDEVMATHGGNNNWYGHDADWNHLPWHAMDKVRDNWFRFYSSLIKYRTQCPLLGQNQFLRSKDVKWHTTDWDNDDSRYLAFQLRDHSQEWGDLYVAFNAHGFSIDITLPKCSPGKQWCRIVDTNLDTPKDFQGPGEKFLGQDYTIRPQSSLLFQQCDKN